MGFSSTEENYLKAIFHLSEDGDENISTNDIARAVNAAAASVTDMLKKLQQKNLLRYEKYHGVRLTIQGEQIAKQIVRKHRLWEVFLVDKLGYSWDKIHDIAEQLEHIHSDDLINKLDAFLGYPKTDPHGDPIPDAKGNIPAHRQVSLDKLAQGDKGKVVGVKDSSAGFLQYLDAHHIALGSAVEVIEIMEFDNSVKIKINQKKSVTISKPAAVNILIG